MNVFVVDKAVLPLFCTLDELVLTSTDAFLHSREALKAMIPNNSLALPGGASIGRGSNLLHPPFRMRYKYMSIGFNYNYRCIKGR
jgi:hypothetical protein